MIESIAMKLEPRATVSGFMSFSLVDVYGNVTQDVGC